MFKVLVLLGAGLVIGLLVATIFYMRLSGPGAPFLTLDSKAVVKEVRQLNELVTVRYSVEKVVGMKQQNSPVGSESILLLVQGKVLAGIDLAALTQNDVTLKTHGNVVIRLTEPHIQEAFIDEKYTKVWDRSVTWWTPWVSPDIDLEHKARIQAIDDIRAAALKMGIMADAKRNAESTIRALLQAFGFEKTTFSYGS
jgi:hypothetical protein